jgi:hypothetical protein
MTKTSAYICGHIHHDNECTIALLILYFNGEMGPITGLRPLSMAISRHVFREFYYGLFRIFAASVVVASRLLLLLPASEVNSKHAIVIWQLAASQFNV